MRLFKLGGKKGLLKTNPSSGKGDVAIPIAATRANKPAVAFGGAALTNVAPAPTSSQQMFIPQVGSGLLVSFVSSNLADTFNYSSVNNPEVARLKIAEDFQATEFLDIDLLEVAGTYAAGSWTTEFYPAAATSALQGQVIHGLDLEIESNDTRKLIGRITVKLQKFDGTNYVDVNQWVFRKQPNNQMLRLTAAFVKEATGSQRVGLSPETLFHSATTADQKKVRWVITGIENDAAYQITGRLLSYRFEGAMNLAQYWGIR